MTTRAWRRTDPPGQAAGSLNSTDEPSAKFLLRPLLRQRAIVLLDRLTEPSGHFIRAGQEHLLGVGVHLLPQLELEAFQLVDRRLQLLQALGVGARTDRAQLADDRLQVFRVHA